LRDFKRLFSFSSLSSCGPACVPRRPFPEAS
jgi:hypothetical protein